MAQSLKREYIEWVTCPFNKQHKVRNTRLQYHIVKCMVRYPEYKTCPFHACHRLKPEDYEEHVLQCPYRKLAFDGPELAEARQMGAVHYCSREFNFQYENWDTGKVKPLHKVRPLIPKPDNAMRYSYDYDPDKDEDFQ